MKNVVIISGHPDLSRSVANRTILSEVAAALPEVQIRKLDQLYPDYKVDVAAEQQALLDADVIVWQFPFSWYNLPALMKAWLDQVFLWGFAFGSDTQLAGKKFIISFTTGSAAESYTKEGMMGHEIPDYFAHFESTANICALDLQEIIYTPGMMSDNTEQKAKEHAARLISAINTA